MAIEQYSEDAVPQGDYHSEDRSSLQKWKSLSENVIDFNGSSDFECNICLDLVQDPVVTLCGHLYCWPCIYKWLHIQNVSVEFQNQQTQQQCPVCKTEVSQDTLVPLFGKGKNIKSSKNKAPKVGILIPQRPLGFASGFGSPRSPFVRSSPRPNQQIYHHHQQQYPNRSQVYDSHHGSNLISPRLSTVSTMPNMFDPSIGVFGEMIYARVFGNSRSNMYAYPNSYNLAGSTSPRVRLHVMQMDRSLSRICFFLFCCLILCLLLF